jgi:hypothetical protein
MVKTTKSRDAAWSFGGNNNNHDDGDACRLIHQIQPVFLS